VLESVATSPEGGHAVDVLRDCVAEDFPPKVVKVMLDQLRREGLVQRLEDGQHRLTEFGVRWLREAAFDKALPTYAERPRARRKRPA
jgi:ribosomal protein S19E (S16A)